MSFFDDATGVESLRTHLLMMGERIEDLERSLATTRFELERLQSARSYRLALRLQGAARRIAPRGTFRGRFLRSGYRLARMAARLRDPRRLAHHARAALGGARRLADHLARPSRIAEERLAEQVQSLRLLADRVPDFVAFETIQTSIIIPVYNHFPETLACLESIARHTTVPTFEVIVVDDASTDETRSLLEGRPNLIYLRNEENLGFIGSCNRGAAAARGDFLVFLNNDTVVTEGWLAALARTFRDFPDTGLAGAKLIYPDGRLQEAGGVIWRDASGWNYGRFDDPDHPRYNFAREADYCSGACVMVPRALFHRLGGFDTRYTPAYYEDTDLAFKIRHAGHKVIYQPLASIIHHEGLTSGQSLDSGVKAYQRVNQAKFRERWRDRLDRHSEPTTAVPRIIHHGDGVDPARGRVLVIDHRLPMPDQDCGSARMYEILRAIRRRGHHVTFVPDNMASFPPYAQLLQGIGVELIHHPYYANLAAFLSRHGSEFDLAIISRADIASRHLFTVRLLAPRAKVVFDTVDLHFVREEREANHTQDPALREMVQKRKRQELQLARRSDLTLVVSPVEREILRQESPGLDVRILSTIYPSRKGSPPGPEDRRTIVFIGGFEHRPNVDAVLYFAKEIFPMVKARIPEAVFQVIGPSPTPEILELDGEDIQILGYVPDVDPYFDAARLTVAPLRYGAGVKGKVSQSMALGVPTVVSSIAAEGMYLEHGRNAMIADDPARFADAVIRVWSSPELWWRLSENGRGTVHTHFSVEAAGRQVDELLAWAGLRSGVRATASGGRSMSPRAFAASPFD